MSELIAALLGIVAGGLLTGIVQLYLSDRERRVAARGAARLLFVDHVRTTQVLEAAIVDGEWWSADLSLTLLDHWEQYRERLAPGIRAPDFTTIDGAFARLRILHNLNESGGLFTDHRDLVVKAIEAQERAGWAVVRASHSRRDRRRELRELDALSEE